MNNEFQVKLIHCGNRNITNTIDDSQKNIFYMPMGLFALANELKQNNFDTEIIHLDLEKSNDLNSIFDIQKVIAVGLDCHWVNQSLAVLNTAEYIKKSNSNIFIFLGGFTASLFAEDIIRDYSYIDGVIRGDAEKPIVELCEILFKRKILQYESHDLSNVQNLVWKTSNGSVIKNDFSYTVSKNVFDKLDYANISLLRNWQSYLQLSTYFTKFAPLCTYPKFLLSIGRGCIYKCSFCGGNAQAQKIINNRKGQIIRSTKSVLATIENAFSYGYSLFYSCYDFEGSDIWYLDLFNKIKEKKLKINFGYGCWKLPTKDIVDALSETFNEVIIEISPETASNELRLKNKDKRIYYTNDEIEDCLSYIAGKNNVKVQLYFGYFLPYDTEDTVFETIDFIARLFSKYSHMTEFFYGNLSSDPGALIFFNPEKYNVKLKANSFKDYIYCLEDYYIKRKGVETPDMTLFLPESIRLEKSIILSNKLRLFCYLLETFNCSLNYLLKKTNDPSIFGAFFREYEFPIFCNNLSQEQLRKLIINLCNDNIVIDNALLKEIENDLENKSLLNVKLKANI